MSTPNPRVSTAFRRYASDNHSAAYSLLERLLRFIGSDVAFADDVLGDLMEERVRRRAQDGRFASGLWYLTEAFRAVPHLAWNAMRHGGPRGRAHVAAIVSGTALLLTVIVVALRSGTPTAVRLEVDGQQITSASDGVIVNTRHPVLLAMRAFDAKGKTLPSADVQYRWHSGVPISVTAKGVITCEYAGDALLRASLGAVATIVRIKCLPVRAVKANMWMQFVSGDTARELSFVALDPDGMPVNRLAGFMRVRDSTIATLKHGRIQPLSPGHTEVVMRFGDGEAATEISVYEPIASFEALRRNQLFVAAPVKLRRGDTIVWRLPLGLFFMTYQRSADAQPLPSFSVYGPVMCMPDFGTSVEFVNCLVRGPGAAVRMTHPGGTASDISGSLMLERRR